MLVRRTKGDKIAKRKVRGSTLAGPASHLYTFTFYLKVIITEYLFQEIQKTRGVQKRPATGFYCRVGTVSLFWGIWRD